MKPIVRSELIYVRVPAGTGPGAAIPFPDQPSLNGTSITGVEAYVAEVLAFTPDRTPVLPLADAVLFGVSFNEGSDKRHQNIPITSLVTAAQGGIWHEFQPFKVDYQKSRVHFYGTAATAELVAVPFLVHYIRPEDVGQGL
jgi:hypothetical protein